MLNAGLYIFSEERLQLTDLMHMILQAHSTVPSAAACVGCGNSLACAAELEPAAAHQELLPRAVEQYKTALGIEEDAMVRSHFACLESWCVKAASTIM